MAEKKMSSDVVRYAKKFWHYLSGLKKIVHMMDNAETFEVYKILEKMLPYLIEICNSEVAFIADEHRNIIKSFPGASLDGKSIPGFVEEILPKFDDDILVITDTTGQPALKELNLDSIMVLKCLVQGKTVWVGVCNGKNELESYLGEDKNFFNYIIKLFFSIYELILKSEKSRVLKQYQAARDGGNWSELGRTSAELVEKYNDITYMADFLDARLSETILKDSLNQKNRKPGLGQVTEVNNKTGFFNVQLTEDMVVPLISAKDHKIAALAGVRFVLYKFCSGVTAYKNKSDKPTTGAAEKYQKWIKFVLKQTAWKSDSNKKDFDYRVDWLRTQWLRIYYLALSGRHHPKSQDGREMRSIYGATWRKTVNLIQEHLKGIPGNTAESGSITINSDWLLAFLAQDALLSRNLCEHYHLIKSDTDESNKTNLLTGAHFFEHLSRFILYILHYIRFAHKEAEHDRKKGPDSKERFKRPPFADVLRSADSSLSESIIFIVSEYAYREIGVPRELSIFEKLKQQLNFELPLYAANEFYRDHCYHVIDVCLLGEFLLSCDTSDLEKKEDIFHKHDDPDRAKVLKNWYIAALCHDLGYVVERVEKLVAPIEKLKADGLIQFNQSLKEGLKKGKGQLKEDIDSLCSFSELGINTELEKRIARRLHGLDHGIIGWLYLCHLLNKLHIKLSSVQPALMAILRHNLYEHDETIHQEPLSLLLILCDHLQEWGRPRVATEQLATSVLENMRFSPQESHFDRQVHLNQFSIKGMLFKEYKKKELPGGICDRCINNALCDKEGTCLRSWPSVQEKGIEFHLVYHGDHEVDIEPVLSWLYFCRDFQCQKDSFGKYLFPIVIHFSHPLSTKQRFIDEAIPDLDIFEDFANKNEDAVYLCHWIECARKPMLGIEYKITETGKDNTKTEEFIIHLEQMGRPLTRELHDTLVKDFIKWKKDWRAEK